MPDVIPENAEQEGVLCLVGTLQAVAVQKGEEEARQALEEEPRRNGRPHRPWDRQRDEPSRHYERFLVYRKLGQGRSVRAAADINKLSKKAQQGTWQYWTQIAHRWHWFDRARAWDDWRQELAQRKADAKAIQTADSEAEELEAERRRQIEAGRKAVRVGNAVVERLISLVESGELDKMTLERVKLIVEGEKKGSRLEKETKAIPEFLSAALAAIAEGQRIQRIAQEQATERRQVTVDLSGIDRLADVIIARVPESERAAVLDEIAAVLRGEGIAERD